MPTIGLRCNEKKKNKIFVKFGDHLERETKNLKHIEPKSKGMGGGVQTVFSRYLPITSL